MDVSEIARIFVAYRSENPALDLNQQIAKMKEIKDQQETTKRLDEYANTLMDQIKEGAGEFASDTVDDLYGEDIEKYKEAMRRVRSARTPGARKAAGIALMKTKLGNLR